MKHLFFLVTLLPSLLFAQTNKNKSAAIAWIDAHQQELTAWSDSIWRYAEPSLKEIKSVQLLVGILKAAGFTVQENVSGFETMFIATYGISKPVIGLYGEYDADPGASNKIVPRHEELVAGGYGHGGGHNLLGVGSLGAALAIKDLIGRGKLQCTIRYYGTTAEGGIGGKTYLARDGYFNGLDFSLYWHPSPSTAASTGSWDAQIDFDIVFIGKGAPIVHTTAGRNALEAVELFVPAVAKLRKQVNKEMRINYIITTGGKDIRSVTDTASLSFRIQHYDQGETLAAFDSIQAFARRAALLINTGDTLSAKINVVVNVRKALHEFVTNVTAMQVVHNNMELLGPITYTPEEQEYSKTMQAVLNRAPDGIKEQTRPFAGARQKDKIYGYASDIGDASWFAPEAYFEIKAFPPSINMHTWQGAAFTAHSIGHKSVIYAAKVLSGTIIDYVESKSLQQLIKKDFEEHTKSYHYQSLQISH